MVSPNDGVARGPDSSGDRTSQQIRHRRRHTHVCKGKDSGIKYYQRIDVIEAERCAEQNIGANDEPTRMD